MSKTGEKSAPRLFLDPTDLTGDNFNVLILEEFPEHMGKHVGEVLLVNQGNGLDLKAALSYIAGFKTGWSTRDRS